MRLHNFFISEKIGDQSKIEVTDFDLINQWRHVLRLNTGSLVVLLDNSGFEYTAQFMSLTYLKAEFIIVEKRQNKFTPKKEIFLFQALIKPDKFEWILEKGTELGVSHFRPILTSRTIVKKLNLKRAEKIVRESAEQSGRGKLPALYEPMKFEEIFSTYSFPYIAFDPSGKPWVQKDFVTDGALGILIGPEGGWSEQELEIIREKKVPIISLGSQILRAETAAIAVAALLLL
ncbi:MAG: RsmE family RNA methyltransferase [Candidatus Taylorbacteria bacterium]|nr:RsmE family RNA methyltransferase [Candidatus Taylorbacteria bacterium]